MVEDNQNKTPTRLEGKLAAVVVCWLLGNGCLLPWNSLLTIEDYFLYLFPKYHPVRVFTLVYQPFAFLTLAILAYREDKLNTRRRNFVGYFLFFWGSVSLLALDLATTGRGGVGTYVGICLITALFGVADAHVQGGMVGDLSYMHPELIQSFLAGLAASGAITSALRMVTKFLYENSENGLRKGALLFFCISVMFEALCLLLYAYVLPKLPIVKYYRARAHSQGLKTVSADLAAGGIHKAGSDPIQNERLTNMELIRENYDYVVDIFLIYLLTLSIFPGFLSEDTGKHSLGSWYVLVLITSYNVWDFIGRYLPLIKFLRFESRKGLVVAVVSRFLLIPCFYFTAKYGDQGWMIMLTSILGLTNGYLTVCVLTSAPKGHKGPEQNALGNILIMFLLGGIFVGVLCDWLWLIGKSW